MLSRRSVVIKKAFPRFITTSIYLLTTISIPSSSPATTTSPRSCSITINSRSRVFSAANYSLFCRHITSIALTSPQSPPSARYFSSSFSSCSSNKHESENNMSDLSSLSSFQALKEQAKACIASKQYADAAALYSQCIDIANGGGGGSQFNGAEDIKEVAILYANRSLCYSYLESRLQDSVSDADRAIQLNPMYLKSYHRKASALMKLGNFAAAKAANDISLSINVADADSLSMSNKINEAIVIGRFQQSINNSWTTQLNKDPEAETNPDKDGNPNPNPNTTQRQVKSGHFVPVSPKPLPNPQLITYTSSVADALGFNEQFCKSSPAFTKFFSGYMDAIPTGPDGKANVGFATGYALSIYGQEVKSNCPFGNGNGYGDGRAISVAEIVNPETGLRWEMQLKGSGGTPYRRGGDGRATLRSSVREFLASEAMHNLGISTTRALSLVFTSSEHVRRPSYSGDRGMTEDQCAISCRVAPSFLRVGHIELFARRYADATTFNRPNLAKAKDELRLIVEHAMFREFGGAVPSPPNLQFSYTPEFQERALAMLRESSRRLCLLTAQWIRVGFCQGNFNSDNCLVSGRTMDYGPFGFMERYDRKWNMWKDSGEHFSFRNQPTAGERNFFSLVKSVALLMNDAGKEECQRIFSSHAINARQAENDVFRQKLGLRKWTDEADDMFRKLDDLMEAAHADYTIFWRQLSLLPEQLLVDANREIDNATTLTDEQLLANLEIAFYKPLCSKASRELASILREWLAILKSELLSASADLVSSSSSALSFSERSRSVSEQMRRVSPKYVPREWMLTQAYKAAEKHDFSHVKELQEVFLHPYEEKMEFHKRFYRKMPDELYRDGVFSPGITGMT